MISLQNNHTQLKSFSLALALAGTCLALPATAQEQLPLPLEEVRIFTQALDRIRAAYVEEVDDHTLLENAIKGMLSGLDPHSSYLVGNDYEALQETTTGEFGGLGIEVGREDGYIKVISPIDDSPADRAGIQAGDLIIQINNRPLRELLPDEAAEMMRGVPGSEITVTIAREGVDTFDVTVVREIITIASVRSRMVDPSYAYLRVSQFRANTGNEVQEEITELLEENESLKGLILDLRNNPGGVLQASVGVVDAFINQGRIVSTKGRMEDSGMEFNATRATVGGDIPLVVLINNGSASASEIVAGALQDHGRAIIMGTRSFGKGSVQTILPLGEDRAIKLTTSLYYTPSGRSIQAQGIEPDIIVEEAFVTRRSRNLAQYSESDLPGHLGNGNEDRDEDGDSENSSSTTNNNTKAMAEALISAEEVLVSDYPLNEALNVLKGINAFRAPQARAASGDFAQRSN